MENYDYQRNPPMLNQRPTQAPLNRDQQKSAFEAMKQQYNQEPPPVPQLGLQAIKEYTLTEEDALRAMKLQLQERNIQPDTLKTVDAKIEEKQQTTTVKQFYCHHVFTAVRASFMGMPIRYKICKTCGLVK